MGSLKTYELKQSVGFASPPANLLKLYYQLVKPGIVYSNAMTAAAGFLLASNGHVNFAEFACLLSGTALIIASACVFNNYIDRGIDAKMARTKKRAIASGKISGKNALMYGGFLGIIGFCLLSRTNAVTFLIGVAAFLSYVGLYGLAKRKTVHGTLVGTLPGAASLVAGYSAASGTLNREALILFLIMVCWQMPHFYSIAIYRLSDYQAAKIPVMPAVKGIKLTKFLIMLYIFGFTLAVIALSALGYTGLTYLLVMGSLSLWWLHKGIRGFSINNDVKWARGMFGTSLLVLLALSALLGLNSWLP
jgi:protoheme IX farnesyltransferase